MELANDIMLIGSMNNPKNSLIKEIRWVKKNFDFLDLTLEMPNSYPDKISIKTVKNLISNKLFKFNAYSIQISIFDRKIKFCSQI